MKTADVTMVRIYLTEGQHQFQNLMALLHDKEKVRDRVANRCDN